MLKQLFDVGELFAVAQDLRSVASTYDHLYHLYDIHDPAEIALVEGR